MLAYTGCSDIFWLSIFALIFPIPGLHLFVVVALISWKFSWKVEFSDKYTTLLSGSVPSNFLLLFKLFNVTISLVSRLSSNVVVFVNVIITHVLGVTPILSHLGLLDAHQLFSTDFIVDSSE